MSKIYRRLSFLFLAFLILRVEAADPLFPHPGALPAPGAQDLRALTPSVLQVRGVAGRKGWDQPLTHWGALEKADFSIEEPGAGEFEVMINGEPARIGSIGFRREPIFVEYWTFDLRILNALFLQLEQELRPGDRVRVVDRNGRLWKDALEMMYEPHRFSPFLHVNHAGYAPGFPKRAYVSGDFGTMGEMPVAEGTRARLVDENGRVVFEAPLERQTETGWKWHQQVWRFDFTSVDEPGSYRMQVDGLGESAPIRIHDAAFAAAARLHALGMLHQRSGFEKKLPFTRIEHAASHTRPADVPTPENKHVQRTLARMVERNTDEEQASGDREPDGPPLASLESALFPFVNPGPVDVSGGHYDAGDYSKYLTNSATLVAALVFATDNFPGVSGIDNLGVPESGDGIPDALQIAKWESDFIAKMQDADGGFYFLVYPRDRSYELDVLPENGDPQVVFPKTTVSTAAAVGALAQCAASPVFRRHFPEDAARYLDAAKKGWEFLEAAIDKHGVHGSFQVISHYGKSNGAVDELCYAAAALFAATGDRKFEAKLRELWPDPTSGQSTRWGWWPLTGAYGEAARVYAFIEQNGSQPAGTCDPAYLALMREAVAAAGDDLLKLARENAFGIPLSLSGKRSARVGWYWAMEFAFDFAAAYLAADEASRRSEFLEVILACFGFEFGTNPSNRVFVSGAGPTWRRQVVNRISLNDNRKIAISGIAAGNVVSTPDNVPAYRLDGAAGLRRMYHPTLADFPFYDRAALDSYNVRAEFVTASTAKILATYLFLMGQTAEAKVPWQPIGVTIEGAPAAVRAGERFRAAVASPDRPLNNATIIWEVPGAEPESGPDFSGAVFGSGPVRLEVEIAWPDGRRAFAVHPLTIQPSP